MHTYAVAQLQATVTCATANAACSAMALGSFLIFISTLNMYREALRVGDIGYEKACNFSLMSGCDRSGLILVDNHPSSFHTHVQITCALFIFECVGR